MDDAETKENLSCFAQGSVLAARVFTICIVGNTQLVPAIISYEVCTYMKYREVCFMNPKTLIWDNINVGPEMQLAKLPFLSVSRSVLEYHVGL